MGGVGRRSLGPAGRLLPRLLDAPERGCRLSAVQRRGALRGGAARRGAARRGEKASFLRPAPQALDRPRLQALKPSSPHAPKPHNDPSPSTQQRPKPLPAVLEPPLSNFKIAPPEPNGTSDPCASPPPGPASGFGPASCSSSSSIFAIMFYLLFLTAGAPPPVFEQRGLVGWDARPIAVVWTVGTAVNGALSSLWLLMGVGSGP